MTQKPTERSVSEERLKIFEQQPKIYGPGTNAETLDLTERSVDAMRKSKWNKEFIYRLSTKTTSLISANPAFAHINKDKEFWRRFYAKRVHALLLECYQRRGDESKRGGGAIDTGITVRGGLNGGRYQVCSNTYRNLLFP